MNEWSVYDSIVKKQSHNHVFGKRELQKMFFWKPEGLCLARRKKHSYNNKKRSRRLFCGGSRARETKARNDRMLKWPSTSSGKLGLRDIWGRDYSVSKCSVTSPETLSTPDIWELETGLKPILCWSETPELGFDALNHSTTTRTCWFINSVRWKFSCF